MMYYYKQVKDGQIVSIESKSIKIASPDFVEAAKEECEDYLTSLPPSPPPKPIKSLTAEIDELKTRIGRLENK